MKKVMAMASAVVFLVCSTAVVGCGVKTYGETYNGAVSEQTYKSADLAVQGFLETEVSGMAFTAVYVGYTKEGELSEREMESLSLSGEAAQGIVSAEKGTVEYTETKGKAVLYSAFAAEENSNTCTKELYVLHYEGGQYRFYSPALKEHDALTASYFASLFAPENFMNCTLKASGSVTMTAAGYGTQEQKTTELEKFTKDAVYISATNELLNGEGANRSTEAYAFNFGDGVVAVGRTDQGKWELQNMPFENIEELVRKYYTENFGNFDHTYFEKTATGYKMKEGTPLYGMGEISGVDFKSEYEVKVSNGKISELIISVTGMSQGGEQSIKTNVTFSDYGKTTVEVPPEVRALAE